MDMKIRIPPKRSTEQIDIRIPTLTKREFDWILPDISNLHKHGCL